MRTTATTRSADPGPPGTTNPLVSWLADDFRRPYLADLGVALVFLAFAAWLGHGLWPDPAIRELALNPEDQILIEWFLAVDTRILLGEHGLITDRLNAPDGINLVANAASPTLGLLLAPITLTLGAPVSFAVLTIGNLAGTATAWYLLFSRTLRVHRAAAMTGGALGGFAPALVSHSNSHWHMAAMWLVPAIVWSLVRLARAAEADDHRRITTSGLWLAGLVVVQYFLGAEVLYLAAVTLILVAIPYALLRRAWARRVLPGFAAGLAIATGLATAALAYPLWMQFAGPGSVPDGPFSAYYFSADLASWPAFSPLTALGTETGAAHLTTGAAEYNTFLGWPLLLVAAACVVWLRDRPLVVAAAIAAGIMAVLSLGPELVVNEYRTDFPLPYRFLVDRPVVDGALPQRYGIAVVPLFATLLALALDRARRLPGQIRLAVPVAAALALLPLLPTPLPTANRPPVPAFISDGHWRDCVEPGGVLVPVPLPTPQDPETMRWAAAANAEFALPEGFFIGPYGRNGRASVGTYRQPTSQLLAEVADAGQPPQLLPEHRTQAERDLAFWGAECVVLSPGHRYEEQLRLVLEELLGPGERVVDAWVWAR